MEMDSLTKTLDFIAKYFWAVFVVAAFVLFAPDEFSKDIGIYIIRENFKGIWWIVFILSGSIWCRSIFKSVATVYTDWRIKRDKENKKSQKEVERFTTICLRLDSLDKDERLWFQYCLFNNTQSLSAQRADRVAQSLVFKKLLVEGQGHILDLPFHIPDDVWEYLKIKEEIFLPEENIQNPQFKNILEKFRKNRHAF